MRDFFHNYEDVTSFRNENLCTKEEAERLITFTNNSGPLFILGTVGITLFYDTSIGILLLFTHILAAITVGSYESIERRYNDAKL